MDGDGDGFMSCEDCDDSDPAVHPDAVEVCDDEGVDEDCNGLVNEDDPGVDRSTGLDQWPDTDGDGLGDAQVTGVWTCRTDVGFVANNEDCNDQNRFDPLPRDWCGDTTISNCAAVVGVSTCSTGVAIEDAEADFMDDTVQGFGQSIAFVPDIDGDGLHDIAIGAPLWDGKRGQVLIYPGTSLGSLTPSDAIATLEGEHVDDRFGQVMLPARWRSSGSEGLIITAPGASVDGGTGAVYLLDAPEVGSARILPDTASVVGAPATGEHDQAFSVGGAVRYGAGTLVVNFLVSGSEEGALAGFVGEPFPTRTFSDANWTVGYMNPHRAAAESLVWADMNRDGESDLVLGNKGGNQVQVLYGPFTGSAASSDIGVVVPAPADQQGNELPGFGRALAAVDLDGSGAMNLIADGWSNKGQTTVYMLSVLSLNPSDGWSGSLITGAFRPANTDKPSSLHAGSDIDADDEADLVWGQPGKETWLIYSGFPLPDSGGATNFYDAEDLRSESVHLAQMISSESSNSIGHQVRSGPDVNGDGRGDLLISTIGYGANEPETYGRVWLFWGGRW